MRFEKTFKKLPLEIRPEVLLGSVSAGEAIAGSVVLSRPRDYEDLD
jgi:hypothetical protein